MAIGINQNAKAWNSPGTGTIIVGALVGAIALAFFIVAVWRITQQFHEMYLTAILSKIHPRE